MSVKFTPGPHPTSLSRSSSSKLPTPTPVPSASSSPVTITFPSKSRSNSNGKPSKLNIHSISLTNGDGGDPGDLERQPLIHPRELNRPKYTWTIITAILFIILIGIFVGFGGWRLGKGEGGGRWPGSPGLTYLN